MSVLPPVSSTHATTMTWFALTSTVGWVELPWVWLMPPPTPTPGAGSAPVVVEPPTGAQPPPVFRRRKISEFVPLAPAGSVSCQATVMLVPSVATDGYCENRLVTALLMPPEASDALTPVQATPLNSKERVDL